MKTNSFFEKIIRLLKDPHATVWNTFGKNAAPPTAVPPPPPPAPPGAGTPPLPPTPTASKTPRKWLKRVKLLLIGVAVIAFCMILIPKIMSGITWSAGIVVFWFLGTIISFLVAALVASKKDDWRWGLGILLGAETAVIASPWCLKHGWAALTSIRLDWNWDGAGLYVKIGAGIVATGLLLYLLRRYITGTGVVTGLKHLVTGLVYSAATTLLVFAIGKALFNFSVMQTVRLTWWWLVGALVLGVILSLMEGKGLHKVGRWAVVLLIALSYLDLFTVYDRAMRIAHERYEIPPTQKQWLIGIHVWDERTLQPTADDRYNTTPATATRWTTNYVELWMTQQWKGKEAATHFVWDKASDPRYGIWELDTPDGKFTGKWNVYPTGRNQFAGEILTSAGQTNRMTVVAAQNY